MIDEVRAPAELRTFNLFVIRLEDLNLTLATISDRVEEFALQVEQVSGNILLATLIGLGGVAIGVSGLVLVFVRSRKS